MMEHHEAIVVGGGIAGLTAAAYLARAGLDVLLLEKNAQCGGLVTTFVKDGFRFEGGVRALESAGIILPMLKELGIHLETLPSPVSVGIEDRIIHVTSQENLKDYENLLKACYSESTEDIERVIALIKRIMKDMLVLYGVDNPLFNDFRNNTSYFIRVYMPWFFKFLVTLVRINGMKIPVEVSLDRIVKDRSLRDIISQHFFRSTPTFFAMSYFYLYTDYFYPKGGVGRLTEAVLDKLLEFGGQIKTGTEITGVDAAENRLVDKDGNLYEYEQLVWAADLKTLYRITNTEGLPPESAAKIAAQKETLLAGRGTDSIFTVYLGVAAPPETFKAISNGHFFYTPSRQGLGETHRSQLRQLLQHWSTVSKDEVFAWLDEFCRLNTYEISIPVLKEPGVAPEGKTGLIVSTLFEYDLVKKVSESGWYEEFRVEVENRMIDVLSASIYPLLKDRLIFKFSTTPLTIEKLVGSSEGAIVGWSFEDPIPVTSSMLGINNAVKTAIPQVMQAGQWSYSPNGVPTAILTGKLAADALIRKRKPRSRK
ncbi:MAG: NAD(P)/FAD-dependent oxidoreductase [Anaerolineae bacterium]|nr:NAD(P)/FAD-dependent oxidoreductase [Anaerolineae bacterium]